MTTFHDFARKIETGYVTWMVKPILKTANVSDKCKT